MHCHEKKAHTSEIGCMLVFLLFFFSFLKPRWSDRACLILVEFWHLNWNNGQIKMKKNKAYETFSRAFCSFTMAGLAWSLYSHCLL